MLAFYIPFFVLFRFLALSMPTFSPEADGFIFIKRSHPALSFTLFPSFCGSSFPLSSTLLQHPCRLENVSFFMSPLSSLTPKLSLLYVLCLSTHICFFVPSHPKHPLPILILIPVSVSLSTSNRIWYRPLFALSTLVLKSPSMSPCPPQPTNHVRPLAIILHFCPFFSS